MTDNPQEVMPLEQAAEPVQAEVPAKVTKERKPRTSKKGSDKVSSLLNTSAPKLATGGDFPVSLDIKRLREIVISKTDAKGKVVPKSEMVIKGNKAVQLLSAQLKAFEYIVLAWTSSPVSDRGYAYREWCDKYAKQIKAELGAYRLTVTTGEKSLIQKLSFTVADVLKAVEVYMPSMSASIKEYPPQGRVRTTSPKEQKELPKGTIIL